VWARYSRGRVGEKAGDQSVDLSNSYPAASVIEQQRYPAAITLELIAPGNNPLIESFSRWLAERNHSLFVSLTGNAQEVSAVIDVLKVQPGYLAYSSTAGVEKLNYQPISDSGRVFGGSKRIQRFEYLGQTLPRHHLG
jgi:hypothetical protein